MVKGQCFLAHKHFGPSRVYRQNEQPSVPCPRRELSDGDCPVFVGRVGQQQRAFESELESRPRAEDHSGRCLPFWEHTSTP